MYTCVCVSFFKGEYPQVAVKRPAHQIILSPLNYRVNEVRCASRGSLGREGGRGTRSRGTVNSAVTTAEARGMQKQKRREAILALMQRGRKCRREMQQQFLGKKKKIMDIQPYAEVAEMLLQLVHLFLEAPDELCRCKHVFFSELKFRRILA